MIEDKNIQEVLTEMEKKESQFKAKWAVDDATGTYLHTWVLEHQPKKILELGTWRGASAIYIASALALIGEGQLVTVDRKDVRGDDAQQNIEAAGLSSYVTQVRKDIDEFLPEHTEVYDLIFLDAAKKQQGRWLKELIAHNAHKQTTFIVDDVITMADRMEDLYSFLKDHELLEYRIEEIDDGLMIITFRD